ncbi:MAG: flagellar protein FlgN [Clostridiales bacterium]|jgi:hypothetical protein|nr:flagellar protein FlgN [Clostridiales bacterium]
MINELINIMKEQLLCYDFLLGLSKEKTEVIINNNVTELKRVTDLENECIIKNVALERRRLEVLEEVACLSGLGTGEMTISSILNKIKGGPGHGELLSVSLKMRESIERLKEANDRNRVLIGNSLEYIDYSMNVIRTSIEGEPAGFDPENNSYISNRSFFDAKQ